MNKVIKIILNILPVVLMIALIPFIQNDYILSGVYVLIIAISLIIKYEKNDLLFIGFGFVVMTLAEYFFVMTGVETFTRNSYFAVMPLWLPFLWGYAFAVMKRVIRILDKK